MSVMFFLEIIFLADSISMYLVANIIAKEHISFILFNANYPVTILLRAIGITSNVVWDRQVQLYRALYPCPLNQLFPVEFLKAILMTDFCAAK